MANAVIKSRILSRRVYSGLSRCALSSMAGVLISVRAEGDLRDRRGGCKMATEAKIRVIHPQVKQCWQPPGIGRHNRTVREEISVVSSPPKLRICRRAAHV